MISTAEALRHLDEVIHRYQKITSRKNPGASTIERHEIYVRLRAAVFRLAPKDSEYEKAARGVDAFSKMGEEWRTDRLAGVAQSLREDFAHGFIAASFGALVRADVFGDFLEMAQHLLDGGYKDPAAVLVGAVLEEHLRKLCLLHGLPTAGSGGKARKADSLNTDLAARNVYSKLDQKSVTAWQDLRNKAAHGHFADYSDAQVDLMLKGVSDFVSRFPA